MAKKETKDSNRDELAKILQETINSNFKKENFKAAHFLDDYGDIAAEVKEWVSTGSSMLDIAISNRPYGGLPVGRVIEIIGLEATGKSLLAAHIIAETQKKDGLGIFIDTESSVSREFISAVGVDLKKMLYIQLEALEDVFQTIESMIEKIRDSDKDKLVTIVVDSVMGASTKTELEADYDRDGWATDKAIVIGKAMRKMVGLIAKERILLVFTNQLRAKLGVSWGDPWCVDPYTTKVKIKYIKKEITLANLAEKFLGLDNFQDPEIYNMDDIEIETIDSKTGKKIYKPIKNFIVKNSVDSYFTDGKLRGTSEHIVVENKKNIKLKNHPDFKKVNEKLHVVDIEVADEHTYLANSRLNHNTTSGGKALAFASSVRLRLKSIGQLKAKVNGVEQTIGIKTKCQVIKSRVGPPLRSADFDIYFDKGIDNFGSWLSVLKDYNLIQFGGAWYTIIDPNNGEEIKFTSKNFPKIVNENPKIKEELYKKICDTIIMKYSSDNFGLDDVEVSDEPIPDEV